MAVRKGAARKVTGLGLCLCALTSVASCAGSDRFVEARPVSAGSPDAVTLTIKPAIQAEVYLVFIDVIVGEDVVSTHGVHNVPISPIDEASTFEITDLAGLEEGEEFSFHAYVATTQAQAEAASGAASHSGLEPLGEPVDVVFALGKNYKYKLP